MCLARGGVDGEGGERMRELGLGFTNPVGTGGVLDMCLCFGCGGGEWVGGLVQGGVGWCYVCVSLDSRCRWQVSCVLCLADTCTSEVHPVFNPVAPYGYLLSDMYLFMADITNPDFLVLSCRTWIGLDITCFCEQQPAWPKNGKSGPHCWGRGGLTQFAQRLESAVTAPPLVGCVVWSHQNGSSH